MTNKSVKDLEGVIENLKQANKQLGLKVKSLSEKLNLFEQTKVPLEESENLPFICNVCGKLFQER